MLIVSIISYAAYPAKSPDPPLRIMFKVVAGKVLFDHQTHTSSEGYGLSCFDCHHHFEEDEASLLACGDCHNLPAEEDVLPETCADCHDMDEIEGTEITKRADAFHEQCAGCHERFEAGPRTEECTLCHVM